MANKHKTLSELFSAIANKIRTYTGSSVVIVADDFPDNISRVAESAVNNFINKRILPNTTVSLSLDYTRDNSELLAESNIRYLTANRAPSYLCFNCYDLIQVTFAYSNINIGTGAFRNCTALQAVCLLNSTYHNVLHISTSAFQDCSMLTTFPFKGVETIGNSAFKGCGFTTITLDSTITSISDNAFENCSNLTVINVPWSEGKITGAPWGAAAATINYNYTGV